VACEPPSYLYIVSDKEKLLKDINIKNVYKNIFFMLQYRFSVGNLYILQSLFN